MEEAGKKFNVEKMEELVINLDECGYFLCYIDKETNFEYISLPKLIDKNKKYLEYEYQNLTKNKIGSEDYTITKQGKDYNDQ